MPRTAVSEPINKTKDKVHSASDPVSDPINKTKENIHSVSDTISDTTNKIKEDNIHSFRDNINKPPEYPING